MRALVLVVAMLAACKDETQFTDAAPPGDGAVVDAKTEIDAEVFVCEDQACGPEDACCPSACHANNDPDCTATCDNGVLEDGEQCDPLASCPSSCAAVGCQLREVTGAACGATCTDGALITACADGDDCCPDACNETNDAECAAVCDNGVIESGEECDPLASCPTACPNLGCTVRTLYSGGTCQAECVATGSITACSLVADGCCPASCNDNNDADCDPFCGNSVVEAGEVCDGNCPTCATETFSCYGETGSAATCDLRCHQPVLGCEDGDACCPYKPGSGGADCNRTGDAECTGTSWRSVSFGIVSFAPCTTVRIYGMERYDSALFTTCAPSNNETEGDTTITAIYQDDGFNYFPSLSIINDDTTDPNAIPLMHGWDCRNASGQPYMSTAPENSGGLILRGTPQPVRVTICGYGNSSGRAPFHVWINGNGNPNPG